MFIGVAAHTSKTIGTERYCSREEESTVLTLNPGGIAFSSNAPPHSFCSRGGVIVGVSAHAELFSNDERIKRRYRKQDPGEDTSGTSTHHSTRTFGLVRNSSLSAIIIFGVEKSGCEETIHLEA